MTRVIFFGTPDQAVPTLAALMSVSELALVVTQPDKARGRSGAPAAPPVKVFSEEHGIELAQPASHADLITAVTNAGPLDLGVVVAYGRILRPEVLGEPTLGILNVHFSLLPRWRGAAPVARALIAGDTMTGVTIIRLDEGLDTGPVLTAQAVDVMDYENAGDLTARLAIVGARLLTSVIPSYLSGELVPVPQSDEGVTYATKLAPGDRSLEQDDDPSAFLARVRGLAPKPGATVVLDGEIHKVLEASVMGSAPPHGTWQARDETPVVSVGGRGIALTVIQPPGKRPMSGADWVRGRHRQEGTIG